MRGSRGFAVSLFEIGKQVLDIAVLVCKIVYQATLHQSPRVMATWHRRKRERITFLLHICNKKVILFPVGRKHSFGLGLLVIWFMCWRYL
jgi:hypothetical protein